MGDWADDCEREADFREEEALEFLKKVNEAQAAVIEAAKTARVPIKAYMQARGVPNTTISELLVAVEALQEVEGE